MYHANLVLFILIGMLCSTITSITIIEKSFECGKNAVWKRCTKCQRTCDSLMTISGYDSCFKPKTKDFHKRCTMECRCRQKYLRTPWGECIRPSQCHPYSPNYRPDF